ncbi:MAG: hypothetical protein U0169_23140 [Polyangiaceae bacterium]
MRGPLWIATALILTACGGGAVVDSEETDGGEDGGTDGARATASTVDGGRTPSNSGGNGGSGGSGGSGGNGGTGGTGVDSGTSGTTGSPDSGGGSGAAGSPNDAGTPADSGATVDAGSTNDAGTSGTAGSPGTFDFTGYWVGTHVSGNDGVSYTPVVRGNASSPGTDQRDFVVSADGTLYNYSHPSTGSVFVWKIAKTSFAQTGSTAVYFGSTKAQGSCNHGDWVGPLGAADDRGEWGGNGTPMFPANAYRIDVVDLTHAIIHVGYPGYAFFSPGGASSVAAAGGTSLTSFKIEKVDRATWLATVRRPVGQNPSPPPVCADTGVP